MKTKPAVSRVVAGGVLLIGLFGGALQAQVTDHTTPGNLESTHDLGCASPAQLDDTHTPADLYRGLAACVEEQQYERGVLLFALAGTYGRYDILRVADETAHQAVLVLRMNHFDPLRESDRQRFSETLKRKLSDPEDLGRLCDEIRRIGAPTYFPGYMVQHGMAAFGGDLENEGLVEGFDAEAAWNDSLSSYLHCPEPDTGLEPPGEFPGGAGRPELR